jgi:hypothetical protein
VKCGAGEVSKEIGNEGKDEKQIKTLDLFRLLLLEILYGNRKPEKQHYRKQHAILGLK